ncbi:MAG: helix-turn-helix transcriptional regulator [Balneolaceae bacterium]|nr:helix-turn-helix transcriptional regulator [Balneolaceae bacterium]
MKNEAKKSPVALAVLALLFEEPMHPYRMWQLIKERSKDEVVNVRYRNTLYQTIDRLVRDELISEKETRKEDNRPEQTIYQLTDRGRETALSWMRQMLAEPADEFPEFPVALAYLPMLSVEEVITLLGKRLEKLDAEKIRIEKQITPVQGKIPRLFLLEMEFILAKLQSEIKWVRALLGDLNEGTIYWDEAWLNSIIEQFKNKP